MARIEIINHELWHYMLEHIDSLKSLRKTVSRNQNKRIACNVNLVLTTACYLEGYLECSLKRLLEARRETFSMLGIANFHQRRSLNFFIMNSLEDIAKRAERSTGVEPFGLLFEILSNKKRPIKLSKFKKWESVQALFHLRNMLAHGREVHAEIRVNYWPDPGYQEVFSGGYKKAEDYLLKKKIIKHRFLDKEHIRHLLTNRVADHYLSVVREFVRFIDKLVETEIVPITTAHVARYDP